MLEKKILGEFQEFSSRRIQSIFNVENDKVWEEYYFSSCGDEFFRDIEELNETIKSTNVSKYNSEFFSDENPNRIIIQNMDYYKNILEFYNENVIENENINLIHFGACRIKNIPFLITNLELRESFSTHADFHAMIFNDQIVEYEAQYVWVLFTWMRINKKPITY